MIIYIYICIGYNENIINNLKQSSKPPTAENLSRLHQNPTDYQHVPTCNLGVFLGRPQNKYI